MLRMNGRNLLITCSASVVVYKSRVLAMLETFSLRQRTARDDVAAEAGGRHCRVKIDFRRRPL